MAFVLDGRIAVRHKATAFTAPATPSQTELTGAVNLVGTKQGEELIGIEGWVKQPSSIPLPGFAGREVGTLAGESTYPQSKRMFRMHETIRVIYSLLVDDFAGYVAICQDGLGSGKDSEIFPATVAVAERPKQRNVAATLEVTFSVSPPFKGVQAA